MIDNEKTPVLKMLIKLASHRPWMYLLNLSIWIAAFSSATIAELAHRVFFDMLDGKGDGTIGLVLWIAGLGCVARVALTMWGSYVDAEHRFQNYTLIQRNLMKELYRKPAAAMMSVPGSEAVTTIKVESETLVDVISWSIDSVGNIVSLLFALGILFSIDPMQTILVYISLVFVVWSTSKLESAVENAREKAQEASSLIGERIGNIFASIQAVQVAGAEASVMKHLEELYAERRQYLYRERILDIINISMFYVNFTLLTAVILVMAAPRLVMGSMSIGDLSIFIVYLDLLTDVTVEMGQFLFKYAQSKIALQRLTSTVGANSVEVIVAHLDDDVDLTKEVVQDSILDPLQNLVIEDLSFSYGDDEKGIDNISFQLPRNSFTVVTGQIGSGKSTLLKVLLGLLPAKKGKVRWNDHLLNMGNYNLVPPYSAYVPQLPILISSSLGENLALGKEYTEERLEEILEAVAFGSDLDTIEKGLLTQVGSRGLKLSGGQLQRVATARALLQPADLLVFDDLSSALDVTTEQQLWHNLRHKEATYLVVSHRRLILQQADQILLLDKGRLKAKGTWQELLQSEELFRGIWQQAVTMDEVIKE